MKRALLAGLAGLMLVLTACTTGPRPTQATINDIFTAVAATISAKKTQGTPMQGTPITEDTPGPGAPTPPATRAPLPTPLPSLSPSPTPTPTETATVTPTASGVTQGLLVYYPLDEPKAAGETVKDESGQGNDAVVSGQPRFVASPGGRLAGAYSFGGSDYLKLSRNPTAGLSAYSVSLWLKTDDPGQDYKLANAASWQNSQGSGWVVGTRLSEAWGANHASLLAQRCYRTYALVPKVWNQLVVTYDRTRFREYVNGRLSTDCPATGQPPGAGQPLEVGGWSPLFPFNYVGQLDEFRVYGRALTPAEVGDLYAPEAVSDINNRLLVYFSFDQPASNVVKDEAPAQVTPPLSAGTPVAGIAPTTVPGHDGTVSGTPGFAPLGRLGGAYDFHNSNLVTLDSNPTAGLRAFAITLWFKTDHPEQDTKLATAASWRAGAGSGWTIGTKFSEFWSDDGKPLIVGQCYRSIAPRPGEWNHLAVSYDGSRLQEYINGDLAMDCVTTRRPLGQGRPLEVGGWTNLPGFDFAGLLDEFRVYGRALSSAEIVVLMNTGAAGHP